MNFFCSGRVFSKIGVYSPSAATSGAVFVAAGVRDDLERAPRRRRRQQQHRRRQQQEQARRLRAVREAAAQVSRAQVDSHSPDQRQREHQHDQSVELRPATAQPQPTSQRHVRGAAAQRQCQRQLLPQPPRQRQRVAKGFFLLNVEKNYFYSHTHTRSHAILGSERWQRRQ